LAPHCAQIIWTILRALHQKRAREAPRQRRLADTLWSADEPCVRQPPRSRRRGQSRRLLFVAVEHELITRMRQLANPVALGQRFDVVRAWTGRHG